MHRKPYTLLLALAAAVLIPPAVGAQALSVIGGGSMARDCYMTAKLASTMSYMNSRSLEPCNYALDYGKLDLRDIAATYVNRGVIHAALEDYQSAFKDYDDALRLKPDFGETYINRGNIFFLGRAYGRAIEDYSKAVEMNISKLHIAYLNRGMAYEKIGDIDQALADYHRALEISPEWAIAQQKLDRLIARLPDKS